MKHGEREMVEKLHEKSSISCAIISSIMPTLNYLIIMSVSHDNNHALTDLRGTAQSDGGAVLCIVVLGCVVE